MSLYHLGTVRERGGFASDFKFVAGSSYALYNVSMHYHTGRERNGGSLLDDCSLCRVITERTNLFLVTHDYG